MTLTPYDLRAFVRSATVIGALALLVYLVMRATDGASTGEPGRLARLAVMVPLLGAIGSGLSNAQARARGEVVALSTVGVRPWRIYAGSIGAAAAAGLAGAALLATPATDLSALFPRVEHPMWEQMPPAWSDPARGIVIESDGSVQLMAARTAVHAGADPRLAVVAMVLIGALGVAVWLELRASVAERVAVGVVVAMLAVAAFHLVAAARISPWALTAVPVALYVHVWRRTMR